MAIYHSLDGWYVNNLYIPGMFSFQDTAFKKKMNFIDFQINVSIASSDRQLLKNN